MKPLASQGADAQVESGAGSSPALPELKGSAASPHQAALDFEGPAPDDAEPLKLYIVETVISHRVRYAIRARSASDAMDEVVWEEGRLNEFDQNCLGEQIFSTREVSEDEFVDSFDLPVEREEKLRFVVDIDYRES